MWRDHEVAARHVQYISRLHSQCWYGHQQELGRAQRKLPRFTLDPGINSPACFISPGCGGAAPTKKVSFMDTVISVVQFVVAVAALYGLASLVKPFWLVKKRWQGALIAVAGLAVFGGLNNIPVARPSSVPEDEWNERIRICAEANATRTCPLEKADVDAARAKLTKGAADAKTAAQAKAGEPSGNAPAASAGQSSKWVYSEDKDAMRGTVTRHAEIVSENELEFDFPYSGGSKGGLDVRQDPHDGLAVLLSITKGQFTCSPLGGHITAKFDNGPVQKFSCEGTSDGTTNVVFIGSPQKFIAALKGAKTVIVEAEFFREGRRQITFGVQGLNWK